MGRDGWLRTGATALALALPATAQGAEAPGAPGASANWTTGNKQGLGTAVSPRSKAWAPSGPTGSRCWLSSPVARRQEWTAWPRGWPTP